MLTLVDEREEAREVLQHVLTSSMMRLDENRFRILIFGLAGKSLIPALAHCYSVFLR